MIYQPYEAHLRADSSRDAEKLIVADFQAALQQAYLPEDENLEAPVFSQAWEYGHSSGLSEVEIYYMDLSELVKHTKKLILPADFKG